jgi:hypothetical protein
MSKKHLLEKIKRNAVERDRYYKMWVDADMEVWKLRRENERLQAELDLIAKGIAGAHQLQTGETYTLTWVETGWTVKP